MKNHYNDISLMQTSAESTLCKNYRCSCIPPSFLPLSIHINPSSPYNHQSPSKNGPENKKKVSFLGIDDT
jgi:hypothetical protein